MKRTSLSRTTRFARIASGCLAFCAVTGTGHRIWACEPGQVPCDCEDMSGYIVFTTEITFGCDAKNGVGNVYVREADSMGNVLLVSCMDVEGCDIRYIFLFLSGEDGVEVGQCPYPIAGNAWAYKESEDGAITCTAHNSWERILGPLGTPAADSDHDDKVDWVITLYDVGSSSPQRYWLEGATQGWIDEGDESEAETLCDLLN